MLLGWKKTLKLNYKYKKHMTKKIRKSAQICTQDLWVMKIILFLNWESMNAVPHYQNLCSWVAHIWGNHRKSGGQWISLTLQKQPAMIMVSFLPVKYENTFFFKSVLLALRASLLIFLPKKKKKKKKNKKKH